MSSEWELDEGIQSIKSAWRREHTARANLEKMLEQAEAENAKLKADAERMFQANVEKNNEVLGLLAENAKLRELVALWSVINKHMSLCATTDCEQCPVREECEESVYLEGLLGIDPKGLSWRVQERMAETTNVQVENAKLRKLCGEMLLYIAYPYVCVRPSVLVERARELRVEVDE